MVDHRLLQRPGVRVVGYAEAPGQVQGVHHLADHVVLHLADGPVADPHRPRPGVPGEVVEDPLGQVTAAVDGVHDLQVLGVAGDRAQQPLSPQLHLVAVAAAQEARPG